MSAQQLVSQLADAARTAGKTLSVSTGAQRKQALNVIADAIEARSAEILAANEKDMEAGRSAGLNKLRAFIKKSCVIFICFNHKEG